MILIPQYRTARRAAASGATPITINQQVTGTTSAALTSVVAGELLIIVAAGTGAITTPSGFSVVAYSQFTAGSSTSAIYSKTATGSEGTIAVTGATICAGYRLSHGTASANTNSVASGTSVVAGSAALDAPAGSVMFAAVGTSGNTSAHAASNSFSVVTSGTRGSIAKREYASADTAENCTLSWTTARNGGSILALISP